MGHGWKDCNYNKLIDKTKCKFGNGYIETYEHICEESDYPPFERSDSTFTLCKCSQKDNCPNKH